MSVKLLTKHHLEFLSLKGGCKGSSESRGLSLHLSKYHMLEITCRGSYHNLILLNQDEGLGVCYVALKDIPLGWERADLLAFVCDV